MMLQKNYILPKFIRLRDAPDYLGMDRNRFNREVRPDVASIPIGFQGIAFDRFDLDQWAEVYKKRVSRPMITQEGKSWVKKERQASSNAVSAGTLKRKSLVDEFEELLVQSRLKKRRQSSRVESKN